MNWQPLTDLAQLDTIDAASAERPILLFKHSTRCNISSAALFRLDRAWTTADDARHTAYHLDLLRHRAVSDAIAQRYGVEHASPQVLVIRHGRCVYHGSHFGINYADVMQAMVHATK